MSLAKTNLHLRDKKESLRNRIRSIASSTAIETGKPVREIEKKSFSSVLPDIA